MFFIVPLGVALLFWTYFSAFLAWFWTFCIDVFKNMHKIKRRHSYYFYIQRINYNNFIISSINDLLVPIVISCNRYNLIILIMSDLHDNIILYLTFYITSISKTLSSFQYFKLNSNSKWAYSSYFILKLLWNVYKNI